MSAPPHSLPAGAYMLAASSPHKGWNEGDQLMHRITALVSSLALLVGLFVYAPQSVQAVDPVYIGPGGGSGACAAPLYETDGSADQIEFQSAVNDQDGDIDNVLYVCPGTYDMDGEVTLDGALTIAGVSGAASPILDASESEDRILYASNALIITGLTFQNAETDGNGAAIYAVGDIVVQNSIFLNNHSFRKGGAIYSVNNLSAITGSTFAGNGSVVRGGAIYSEIGIDLVDDSTFSDNTTGMGGGAIFIWQNIADANLDGQSGIIDSTFSGNEAGNHGGGVAISGDFPSTAVIVGNEFSDNVANADANGNGHGGAVWVDDDMNGTVSRNAFTGNRAVDGGALYAEESDDEMNGTISYNSFVSNVATDDGGALYVGDINEFGVITRNQFKNNTAGGDGGGAWIDDTGDEESQFAIVTANTFSGNRAVGNGGGMYVSWTDTSRAPSEMTRNTFSRNRAGGIGGGIAIMGLDGCVELTTREAVRVFGRNRFSGNRAQGSRQTASVGAVPPCQD